MKRPSDTPGFTLIELMVVIAIIGVIAAIATPAMTSYISHAKVIKATAEIERIYKALFLLEVDADEWPGHQEAGSLNIGVGNEIWDLSAPNAGLIVTDGSFPNWAGPYLPTIPKDPWGKDYFFDTDYDVNGENHVVLGSFGLNGVGPNVYDDDDVIKIIQ